MRKAKNTQRKRALRLILITILTVIILAFVCIVGLLFESGRQVFDGRTAKVQAMIENNPAFFEKVFNEYFPMTSQCLAEGKTECATQTRTAFDHAFSVSNQDSSDGRYVPNYFGNKSIALNSSQPMYFVRLQGDTLEKLFFSGDLKVEKIDTSGEEAVKQVLLGNKEKLYGLQANLNGLKMLYLHDFDSEAEVIVPFRKDDSILGAVVFLHGD